MQELRWHDFTSRPDVAAALRSLSAKLDELDDYELRDLVIDNAATVFETWFDEVPGMGGSLKVLTFADYYIVVDRCGDCHGPVLSFQEVIDAGAFPTGGEDPVVECSLSDEETFAMASEMVGLKGGIVINGEKMVVNEETLTPDWRAPLGEERDGLVCVGSGDHRDFFIWDEAEEWLAEATSQFTQLRDGIQELGGHLASFDDAPHSYHSFITETLGLEFFRYFYDLGPGRSGYEIYAWGEPGSNAQDWIEIYANVVETLKSRLPNDVDTEEIGDDLDALFNLLREHDVRL
jgi:hypothetical protein